MRNLIIALLVSLMLPVVANAQQAGNVVESPRKRVVVLDPGHGGPRPGKVVGKVHEADIVLDISKEVRRQLATKMPRWMSTSHATAILPTMPTRLRITVCVLSLPTARALTSR